MSSRGSGSAPPTEGTATYAELLEPLPIVIVTLKTDTTLRGVLREIGTDGFVLAAAQIAGEIPNTNNIAWRSLPGEVVIPFSNVDYYQRSLPPELLARLES